MDPLREESPPTDRELLRGLYPKLRAFAAVVGPHDVGPDDLLHDTLVRVLSKRSLTGLDYPLAYLRRAILNEAANQRRRLGRGRVAYLKAVPTGQRTDDVYPHDLDYLKALQPRERAVLYLHEVEGFDYEEVADATGVSEANARQIARRARATLRRRLEVEA